ncbi:hypothetical protein KI387_034164, partial [Taxus chinensis]
KYRDSKKLLQKPTSDVFIPCEISSWMLTLHFSWGIQAPSQLKELLISQTFLEEFPDLNQLDMLRLNPGLPPMPIQGCSLLKSCKPRRFVLNSGSTIDKVDEELAPKDRTLGSTIFMSSYFPNLLLFSNFDSSMTVTLNKAPQSSIDLAKVAKLNISECHELEELCLEGLYCLETIIVERCEKLNCLDLNGYNFCRKLEISKCGKLDELCLEHLKLNCLQLTSCGNLRRLLGNFDVTELVISDCAKLEELPNLFHVERIEINRCQKLQNIAGIEELQRLKSMHLSHVGSNFIHGLQRLSKLPSGFMTAIERAVDGGES